MASTPRSALRPRTEAHSTWWSGAAAKVSRAVTSSLPAWTGSGERLGWTRKNRCVTPQPVAGTTGSMPSLPSVPGPAGVVAQVALDLGHQLLGGEVGEARRPFLLLVVVLVVGVGLQPLDVAGQLRVLVDQVGHGGVEGPGLVGQGAGVDGHRQQPPQLLDQGHGAPRVGGQVEVVGQGGPQPDRRDALAAGQFAEDAEDAGRPLVAGDVQPQALGQVTVAGRADHLDRPGVGDVGQQGAHRDQHLDPQAGGDLDDLGGEGPPAQVGLVPSDHDQVVVGRGQAGGAQLDGRPLDPPVAVDQPHRGPGGLEVVELLGVDGGEGLGRQGVPDRVQGGGGGLAGVVPAVEGGQQHWPTEPGPPDQRRVVHDLKDATEGKGGADRAYVARATTARAAGSVDRAILLATEASSPSGTTQFAKQAYYALCGPSRCLGPPGWRGGPFLFSDYRMRCSSWASTGSPRRMTSRTGSSASQSLTIRAALGVPWCRYQATNLGSLTSRLPRTTSSSHSRTWPR